MTIAALFGNIIFSFLIPFLFAVFFVVFIWGIFFYVIAGGHDEESREKGKALLMYGFLGFVLLILISLVVHSVGV